MLEKQKYASSLQDGNFFFPGIQFWKEFIMWVFSVMYSVNE